MSEAGKADIVNKRLIYGRRQGHRLHPNQARLVDELLPQLRPDLSAANLPTDGPAVWFDSPKKDYALEIGFGGGEHLAARAIAERDIGHIGCEPFINGVAKLLLQAEAEELNNLAIHDDDARDVLAALPDGCIGTAYLLYPDPWPKKRHHKRRFINSDNLAQLFRILRPGGSFLVASDITAYIDWTLIHMRAHGGFDFVADAADDWRCPPPDWPGTRYEAKAIAAGRPLTYLTFLCREGLRPGQL